MGKEPNIYFWRDSNQNEVDLLIENNSKLQAIEIKSAATMNPVFFKTLKTFQSISNINSDSMAVVYGGDLNYQTENGMFVSWKNMKF